MHPAAADVEIEQAYPRLIEGILRSARQRVDKFEIELLQILRDNLNLRACSCYSLNPYAQCLSLRGQVGLSYDAYETFALGMQSPAGLTISSSEAVFFQDLRSNRNYVNKGLIQRFGLDRMIGLPIRFERGGGEKKAVCTISAYLMPEADEKRVSMMLARLLPIIEMAFQFSMDHTKHLLRRQLVDRAIHVSDASSFLYRMLQILKQEWNFEAGSVFQYDPRANCLRLAATTGLDVSGIEKRHIFYRLTEVEHQTVRAFCDMAQLTIEGADLKAARARYREKLDGRYHSALVTPFFAPTRQKWPEKEDDRRCLGVLRLVNRQIIHNDQVQTAEFTWEDIEIIEYLCDLIGVVTHLYQQVAQRAADFERIVHGLETSILTVVGALHNVAENVDYERLFPSILIHAIPDSIAFAESIHEQIRVFKMRDAHALEVANFSQVLLVRDILYILPKFAKNSAQFFGVSSLNFDRSDFFQASPNSRLAGERYIAVPPVHTDAKLLLAVFKNLIENAIKYSKLDKECHLKLSWERDDEFVEVCFADAGIGVPSEDEDFIFYESYQAENAIRRRTQGTGIGLYQCRLIMDRLGGSVTYRRKPDAADGLVTNFIVRIPRGRPADDLLRR